MTSQFLQMPNLPKKRVQMVAISEDNFQLSHSLEGLGITCLKIAAAHNLQIPVASHADMNLLHLGSSNFAVNCENPVVLKLLSNNRANPMFQVYLKEEYPADIGINIAIIGNYVFCNKRYAHSNTIEYLCKDGKKVIHVNQGYTRCSIAIVSETAIMTADSSIHSACGKIGIDSLLLECGDIVLPGYDYGFIGGCCGLIDSHLLAFTGDLDKYREGENIRRFLDKHECDYLCLTKNNLIDIGGILPLKEFI